MAKEIRRIALSLALLVSATMVFAQHQLNSLDIQVILNKNGDARISEIREMVIDSTGSECSIGLGDMSPSTVKDLIVSDETGESYEYVGAWEKDRSRSEKEGRCGIVKKDDGGIELCWGIGESGRRTFVTSYTITGLVRGYSDADAICHVFLDKSATPKPEWARVTLVSADTTVVFTPETCGLYSSRFKGGLYFVKGAMVAMTTEPMNAEAALQIMAKFPKGKFKPTIQVSDDTFDHKKQLALEGKDFSEAVKEKKSVGQILLTILKVLGIIAAVTAVLGGLYYLFKKSKKK